MNTFSASETTMPWSQDPHVGSRAGRDAWAALAWQQWIPVRRIHGGFFIAWLVAIWVLLLVAHPGWMIAFGLLYTIIVTPWMAGTDIINGTEEFSFALPLGRRALFLARMGIGLAFILVTTGLGSLAMAIDAPQALWSLVASSGITKPNPPVTPAFLYPMAVLVPAAAFAGTFVLASLAGTRALVGFSWLIAVAAVGIGVFVMLQIESAIWNRPVGWIVCVTLLLATVSTLLWGYLAYGDKEAVIGGGRVGTRWGTGVIAAILIVFVVFLLAMFWSLNVSRRLDKADVIRHEDAARTAPLEIVEP